jgi:hypothetical protein
MIDVYLPFESFVAVSSGRLCCAIMHARVRADQQLVPTKKRPFLINGLLSNCDDDFSSYHLTTGHDNRFSFGIHGSHFTCIEVV